MRATRLRRRREAPFDQSEFARRAPRVVRGAKSLFIQSPEDSILRKLLWYRDGGASSDRQWRDVVEIFRVSGAELDQAYLLRWADALAVRALLQRAQQSAR